MPNCKYLCLSSFFSRTIKYSGWDGKRRDSSICWVSIFDSLIIDEKSKYIYAHAANDIDWHSPISTLLIYRTKFDQNFFRLFHCLFLPCCHPMMLTPYLFVAVIVVSVVVVVVAVILTHQRT